MSKADDLIPLPDGMSVQRLTVADKDEVIKIHDNVKDGTDRLPAYYDYLISLPEVIALGIYMNEKMVGFTFAQLIDDESTLVIRMPRINPEYQGRYLLHGLFWHAGYWAVRERGATHIVSTEEDIGPLQENKLSRPRYSRVLNSWTFVQMRLDPKAFEPFHTGDKLATADLHYISDKRLSELFQNGYIRDYIAPTGVFMVHSVPLKPIDSNIPFIRGVENSTCIYSDLKQTNNECHGLLSCSSTYTMPEGRGVGNIMKLDVFGDDPSSLRKHFIRHLVDMTKTAEDVFALNITLPEGFKLDEIGHILKDYGVEIEEWRLSTATSSRVRLLVWK